VYSEKKSQLTEEENTKKIQHILANPDNYSLEDLLKIEQKDLEGVDEELKSKLFELVEEKTKKKFTPDENERNQDQQDLPQSLLEQSISTVKNY